jgi:hypothetical protein
MPPSLLAYHLLALVAAVAGAARPAATSGGPVYLWPLPKSVSSGSQTLTVDPGLALDPRGPGGGSPAVAEAFRRYRRLVLAPWARHARREGGGYDVAELAVVVASANETVRAGPVFSQCVCVCGKSWIPARGVKWFRVSLACSWSSGWTRATPSTWRRPAAPTPSWEGGRL